MTKARAPGQFLAAFFEQETPTAEARVSHAMGLSIAARAFVQWITRPSLGPTWGETAEHYEREMFPTFAPASRPVYRSWLKAARGLSIGGRALVEHRLGELKLRHVQVAYRQLVERTPNQADQVARMVGRVVQWAHDTGIWVGQNPARSFRGTPRVRREHPLDEAQLRALMASLEDEDVGRLEERLLLRFIAQTGWRIGEAMRLEIGDVHGRKWKRYRFGIADLRTTKCGPQRRYISGAAIATIRRATQERKDGLVFTRTGRPLRADATRDVLTQACNHARIERRVPHDLRHTFASMLERRGASITDVAALVGHRSTQTTLRYCHAFFEGICGALRIAEKAQKT